MIFECSGNSDFWLNEVVDNLLEYVKKYPSATDTLVCAAGMTPSAPIHFGILREIALSSFVTDELIQRKIPAKLIYYWDDYDHFCKIPYFSSKEDVEEHLGKNLREVPDLFGNYASYGEHIMRDFERLLHYCGFFPYYDYQSETYASGKYNFYMEIAFDKRKEIFDIFNESKKPYTPELEELREKFYPFEVYCENCGKDSAKVYDYNKDSKVIKYRCNNCHHEGEYILGKNFQGKLFWKVNWAMRWVDSCVKFESSGENQLTEMGSYAVSNKIAKEIFGGKEPFSLLYRFIGAPGLAKVSRAQGEATLATKFVEVLEPSIVRWLLVKNSPHKPFTVDIAEGVPRIYNEWDKFEEKVLWGEATETEKRIYEISIKGVVKSRLVIPFKTITTALAIANGDLLLTGKMLNKISNVNVSPEILIAQIKPRLNCASAWLYKYGYIEKEPKLNKTFNSKAYEEFSLDIKFCLTELVENFSKDNCHCNEETMTNLLYTIPKIVKSDENELKDLQKEFFKSLYLLLLGTQRGPKLGTLLSLVDTSVLKTLIRGE